MEYAFAIKRPIVSKQTKILLKNTHHNSMMWNVCGGYLNLKG